VKNILIKLMVGFALAAPLLTTVDSQSPECSEHIQAITAALPGICVDLPVGQACTANETVTLSVPNQNDTAMLTHVDDRADLAPSQVLHTSAFDPVTGVWGIAVLHIPADPQPVWVLMTGDMQFDYQSPAEWHVLANTTDALQCNEEKPALTLAVPAQHTVLLNGKTITFEAALAVIHQPTRNSLALTIHDGLASVADGPVVGAGQTAVAVTDNDGNIAFWSAPRAHYDEETQHAQITIQALNGLLNAQYVVGPAASSCQPQTHIVQPGEWVYKIARQYDVTVDAILAANDLSNPNVVYAGQQLIIPCPGDSATQTTSDAGTVPVTICENSPVHRVSQGETLYRIALRYGVTVDAIVAANQLPNAQLIYVGQELVIPCGVDSGTSAVAPAQPGDDSSALPVDSGPPPDICQHNWGDVPFDVDSFIGQLCAQ
jgi:LysM repeat protein